MLLMLCGMLVLKKRIHWAFERQRCSYNPRSCRLLFMKIGSVYIERGVLAKSIEMFP